MGDQPDSDDYSTDEYKRKRGEGAFFFKVRKYLERRQNQKIKPKRKLERMGKWIECWK